MGWKRLALLAPLAAGALAVGLSPQRAEAQDPEALRRGYMIELPPTLPILSTVGRTSPGSSSGSPSAFGANFGDGFVGAGFQARTRNSAGGNFDRESIDGSVVGGFGLGNSRDLIGLEVAITSVSTFDSGFFDKTAFSFKVHRVLPGNLGVAVGYENAITIGEGLDGGNSLYGAVSRVWGQGGFNPFKTVTTTLGIGNGRFLPEEDFLAGEDGINVFGSIGVQVFEPMSLIADWTGQDLTLAASIVPFQTIPLILTPGIADVTGTAGDGARFILGAGMGFDFASLPRLFP